MTGSFPFRFALPSRIPSSRLRRPDFRMTETTTPPGPDGAPASGEAPEPAEKSKKSTRQRAVRGSLWSVGSDMTREAIRLGGNLILTYLLPREFFGYMTPINTFQMGIEQVSSVGIRGSLIRSQRGDEDAYIQTAWTIQVIRGFVLFAISLLLAYPMALAYPEVPYLQYYIPLASVSLIFAGVASTSIHLFVRHLDLKKVAFITVSSAIIRLSVMATWAFLAPSLYALVIGAVIFQGSQMVLSHLLNPGKMNRFHWDRPAAKEIFDYGKWIFLGGFVTFGVKNIDRLLILKVVPDGEVGAALAGVFAIAVPFSRLPHKLMSGLAQKVLFPVYAKFTREKPEILESRVLRARGVVLQASFLGCLAIALGGPSFFALLYKAEYAEAGWMVQWLVTVTWFGLLTTSVDRVLLSLGDSRAVSFSHLGRLVIALSGCLIGNYYYELPGFIGGLTLGAIVGHIIIQLVLLRRGIHIIAQDLKYTALLALLWATGVGLVWLSGNPDPSRQITFGSLAIPAVILTLVGGIVSYKIYGQMRDRKVPQEPVIPDTEAD